MGCVRGVAEGCVNRLTRGVCVCWGCVSGVRRWLGEGADCAVSRVRNRRVMNKWVCVLNRTSPEVAIIIIGK